MFEQVRMFEGGENLRVFPLEYANCTETRAMQGAGVDEDAVPVEQDASLEAAAEVERRIAEACEQTRMEVLAENDERMREDLRVERTAIAHACTSFGQARTRYFAEVEGEVVKLALAIAERVLQREVAMDATLLAGVVRVALSKLGDSDGAVLRVPESETELWRRAMKSSGVQVVGEDEMAAGELSLEAAGGIAELGVRAQLVEIERGFFDLLEKRPA